jgi:hypothetical protein
VNTRRQLSLYVPRTEGALLEAVRRVLDPCAGWAHTGTRDSVQGGRDRAGVSHRYRVETAEVRSSTIMLDIGSPVKLDGHGVLLPCVAGEQAFHQLRSEVLGTTEIRRHAPHITLAHPRNPPPARGSLVDAMGLPENLSFTFATIFSIEQIAATLPWRVLREFALTRQ